ncbi:MAG: hypothetical protein EOO85_26575 [Pedobacter sp.]|nr:MAG: hypothetical protein EOO85_26575 [Pedobacter sp.]
MIVSISFLLQPRCLFNLFVLGSIGFERQRYKRDFRTIRFIRPGVDILSAGPAFPQICKTGSTQLYSLYPYMVQQRQKDLGLM